MTNQELKENHKRIKNYFEYLHDFLQEIHPSGDKIMDYELFQETHDAEGNRND